VASRFRVGWLSRGSGGTRNRAKVNKIQSSGNALRLKNQFQASRHSAKGPVLRLILPNMIFRETYPIWDRIVKGPQISDEVLSHNDSMYMRS